jgi:PAS domain S-box-containing protein
MNNLAHELFLLTTNLTQIGGKDRIIDLFIESLNSVLTKTEFSWYPVEEIAPEPNIPACTRNKTYGYIYSKRRIETDYELFPLIQNAVQFLAILIEKQEQDELLSDQKIHLQYLVDEKTNDLKLKQIELTKQEALYRAIIGASPDGIVIIDLKGNISLVSPSGKKLIGSESEDKILGKNIYDFIIKEQKERAHKNLIKLIGGAHQDPEEYNLKRCDGTILNVEINAESIKNSQNKPGGIVCIIRDISLRKQIEEALRESEEIFSQFMENSPIFIFFKDIEMRSLKLSRNYEQMLGRPIKELLGKTMNELFPTEMAKKMMADDLRILNEGKQVEIEEDLNGRQYTTIKFPIYKNGKPQYLAGYSIDITESRKAATELKRKANELERFNNLMLGREIRMIELKKEINELLTKAGEKGKYKIHE